MCHYDVDGYHKHKAPKGWGSICPKDLPDGETAQTLLNSGVRIAKAIYNVAGGLAFKAQEHQSGKWHGYPIPWTRLPVKAAKKLIERDRLDRSTYNKALRKHQGKEFSQ